MGAAMGGEARMADELTSADQTLLLQDILTELRRIVVGLSLLTSEDLTEIPVEETADSSEDS